MSTVTIHIACEQDIERVAVLFDLYRQFYEQEPDLDLAREFIKGRIINKESVVLIAQNEQGDMIGFCQLYPTFCSVIAAPIYALYDLFVIPEKRRSNVGRALLERAEALAFDNGFQRMDLTTARSNLAAQSLYESLGWKRDNVFVAYNKWVNS